jgi:hypothetical protein
MLVSFTGWEFLKYVDVALLKFIQKLIEKLWYLSYQKPK